MKGYVKIEATTQDGREGLSVDVDVSEVSMVDKFQMVHALTKGLQFDKMEMMMFIDMYMHGVLDDAVERVEHKPRDEDGPSVEVDGAGIKAAVVKVPKDSDLGGLLRKLLGL